MTAKIVKVINIFIRSQAISEFCSTWCLLVFPLDILSCHETGGLKGPLEIKLLFVFYK